MWAWLLIVLAFAAPSASADAPIGAANRFPQPVRTLDLIGRKLLEPKESQPLLGRVNATLQTAVNGSRPLGALAAGTTAAWFGVESALALVAVSFGLSTLVIVLSPLARLRAMPTPA